MRDQYEKQLKQLKEELVRMGELCEKAIGEAAKALDEGNLKRAKEVMEADGEIDRMEKDIESLCLKLLLQQQPVAGDLRQISAALKMITDMERIGDQAADIAEIIQSGKMTEGKVLAEIGKMARSAAGMVNQSVSAYVKGDRELAKRVIAEDDIVDRFFDQIKDELISSIAAGRGDGSRAIDQIMIAKYLERIGDHATNIAEWVEYSITGIHQSEELL
ncbi:phosphate signaling complex protein PhoU [Cuneatibacter sp. NSJ-177]|uniref:phosphate signaling complex protein PhoU n=1 Tax=Cuneatibacter sp. NSJ-177 TaxID=2931401 RepID=UPI001FD3D385|nr:phosphate signaling complex protein PhoU [Cuneatibacter sp. NSJ-177]MCJ7834996.1 phosphate signaling complex protein PhoU [Cuneatibacter sp. NSJ-177]